METTYAAHFYASVLPNSRVLTETAAQRWPHVPAGRSLQPAGAVRIDLEALRIAYEG